MVCALHAISGEKAPRSPLHSLLLCCCDLSSSPADTHTINLPCFSPLLLSKMKGLMWLTHRRSDATPGRCTVAIILQSGETFWQRWDVVLWFYWTFFKCIFSGKPVGWANTRSATPWKTSVLLFPIHLMKACRIQYVGEDKSFCTFCLVFGVKDKKKNIQMMVLFPATHVLIAQS